jgi:hypothetical protein
MGHSGGRKLVKLSGPDSHEALPRLAPSRQFVENFESLDRWKWHFQSLLYLFGIMICESMLFVIIEIRTLYMVFKFKNFFAPPPLSPG